MVFIFMCFEILHVDVQCKNVPVAHRGQRIDEWSPEEWSGKTQKSVKGKLTWKHIGVIQKEYV